MRWPGRATTLVVMLGLAIAFAVATPHFRFTTKITAFLPDQGEDRGAKLAALLADSELSRVLVIDVTLREPAAAPERLRELTLSFLHDLRAHSDVAVARTGYTEQDLREMLAFLGQLPPTTFLPRSMLTEDAVRERLSALLDDLSGATGMLERETAPRDPLGGVWILLDTLRAASSNALVDDEGVVMSSDRQHAFVFVETRSSSFDTEAQQRFRAWLAEWMAEKAPASARMQTAGTAQFAIASETQIKGDVNRIGIVSTIGIVALFLLMFGSVRLIALAFVPMLFGSAIAVLGCQLLFGETHGITIAFGTSLLGVGLDYVEHYYAHIVLTPTVPARAMMKRVAPSLAFGAITTIIGFIGIAASGVMGLRQMAVFSVIAIIGSMSATYWIVPQWMPAKYRPPRALGIVNRAVLALLVRLQGKTWTAKSRLVLVALASIAAIAGLWTARFSDNVNMLVDDHGPHVVEDRTVRSRLGPESSSYAVVTAPTDDALLTAIGVATAELERAQAAGAVTRFVPLDRIVPSREEQATRYAAARANIQQIRRIMEELEFVPAQFAPFWDSLAATTPAYLTLADARRSPLAPLLTAWVPANATPVALIPLVGVEDVDELRAAVPSASIVVPQETIVELFRSVRIQTVLASVIGFAVIFLLLTGRYWSVRKAVVALTPAMLACIATVGVLAASGVALTILHVMSLLLVLSLGVDFGIFFVDTTATVEQAARTMVSILTASVTTILSFGLLGLSPSPGLAAIGITVTLGVTFSLLFCFAMVSLSSTKRAEP